MMLKNAIVPAFYYFYFSFAFTGKALLRCAA